MSEPIPRWPGRLVGSVHVRATPDGDGRETALYVHGLAGSATNWTDLMGELLPDISGYAVDLPGFGYSPPPPDGDYSLAAHSRAVGELIDRLDRGPVHLVGNSLGGAVAVRLAASRPDLVKSLTLISPALPDRLLRYGPARVLAAAVPRVGPWLLDRLRRIPAEDRMTATMEMVYGDPARVHPTRLADAIAELERRDALGYAAAALSGSALGLVREYLRAGLWREVAAVRAPTLLVHGRMDRLVDPRTAVRASRTLPDVRIVVLREAGHVAQMEFPAVVARHVRGHVLPSMWECGRPPGWFTRNEHTRQP